MNDKFMSWEAAVQWLRRQSDKKELVRACFYDDPIKESAERYYHSTEWQAVRNILSSISLGKALDIGAGRGISSYALARDGWSVTALEPDPSEIVGSRAISQLVQAGERISIVEEFGEALPFASNSFDLVYGRAVLHHAKDLKQFCREAGRVLVKGGVFLATREHVISKETDLRIFLASHPLHRLYGGENALLLSGYIDAITGAGLELKEVLDPYDSDINLFPNTQEDIRKKITNKARFTLPEWIVRHVVIPILNTCDNTPGRLYSFLGVKP